MRVYIRSQLRAKAYKYLVLSLKINGIAHRLLYENLIAFYHFFFLKKTVQKTSSTKCDSEISIWSIGKSFCISQ